MMLTKAINNLLEVLIRNICKLYIIDKNLIVLVFKGYSGSNLSPLMKLISNGKLEGYDVEIVREYIRTNTNRFEKLKMMWIKYKLLNKAKLIITTHGPMKVKRRTINLELWHGFPIKGMNLMDGNISKRKSFENIDYAISLSSTYSSLLNSCIGIDGEKYKITGYPRNDTLFKSDGRKLLSNIFGWNLSNKKIILFMPTYRKTHSTRSEDGKKNYSNFFGFDYFDVEDFNSFLESNDYIFVLKLHPNEEEIFKTSFNYEYENIKLLLGSTLSEYQTDLYEIVNAADVLITDFSSIYFDYLLLNRPIIFTPVDIESYSNKRGFLVNPIEFWLPGDICLNYNDLIKKIKDNILTDKNATRRNVIKNIVHKNDDSDSLTRVIDLIKDIMKTS